MKSYTVEIDDDKSGLFEDLMKEISFVHHVSSDSNVVYDVRESIKQGVREVNLAASGQIKLRDAKEFLSELRS